MYDTHALDMAARRANPNTKHAAECGCTARGVGAWGMGEPSALELA